MSALYPAQSPERVSLDDFPLATGLPSIGTTGVTHVFPDFFGTMPASDSSRPYFADYGHKPCSDRLPPMFWQRGNLEASRLPRRRSFATCRTPTTPGSRLSLLSNPSGCAVLSSVVRHRLDTPAFRSFGAQSPGPLHAPLRFAPQVALRHARGRFPAVDSLPGQDLLV